MNFKVTGRILPISDDVKKLNPKLFAPMGALAVPKPEHPTRPALVRKPSRHKKGAGRLVCVITLIRIGKDRVDGDNCAAGFKPLQDAIADTLGVDDDDPRIKFVCESVANPWAQPGTIVRIERIK